MENMEAKATLQLLNIQDSQHDFIEAGFYQDTLKSKVKHKSKLTTARTLTSHSSCKDVTNFERQNNKELLKSKLKKLLEKDHQTPKSILKRIKTTGSESSSFFEAPSKKSRPQTNQQSSQLLDLKKRSILSIQKENIVFSQKNLLPQVRQGNVMSIFEQESEQIRKLIKRRLEQKTCQKRHKNVMSSKIFQNIEKIKSMLNQKNVFLQKNDENGLIKLRNQQKQSSRKFFTNQLLSEKFSKAQNKSKDKQNIKLIPSLSGSNTPVNLHLKKQHPYQSRKLRNILF